MAVAEIAVVALVAPVAVPAAVLVAELVALVGLAELVAVVVGLAVEPVGIVAAAVGFVVVKQPLWRRLVHSPGNRFGFNKILVVGGVELCNQARTLRFFENFFGRFSFSKNISTKKLSKFIAALR